MEKKSISKIVNMLRSSSINKVTMVNILMQENTYDEMHTIYAKVPGIFKSIFALPYLKRKSYSEVYGTGYVLQKDNIVEYIGILAFVFELNHNLLNKFVQLRQKFEDNLLIGNYNLAYQYLNEINISISYSSWASSHEIKLVRLSQGLNASTQLYNKISDCDTPNSLFSMCAFKSSSIDYPFDADTQLYYNLAQSLEPEFRSFIILHCFPYMGGIEGNWIFRDSNSSLIDLYLSLRENLWYLPEEIIQNTEFRDHIKRIASVINDPLLHKFCYIQDIDRNFQLNTSERDLLIYLYYTQEYNETIEKGRAYLEQNPSDMSILDLVVRAMVLSGYDSNWLNKDGSIFDKIFYHYFNLLAHKETFQVHLKRLRTICQSQYSITGLRHLYEIITSFDASDIHYLHSYSWRFSFGLNLSDLVFFSTMEEKEKFIYDWNSPIQSYFYALLNESEKIVDPEFENIQLRSRNDIDIVNYLEQYWHRKEVPVYLENVVATFLFNYYAFHSFWHKAVLFYVNSILEDKTLDIKFDKKVLMEKMDNEMIDDLNIPLEMSIFYTLIDATTSKRYLSYKHYLKQIGVSKASEIKIVADRRVKYFLYSVADQKVIGLHRRQFKNQNEVIEERLSICNNLYEIFQDKCSSDEIASLIKTNRIKGLIKQVDESKIYVDEDGIRRNELADEELIFTMFQSTDSNIQYEDQGMQFLVKYLKSLGRPTIYLGNLDEFTEVNYKLSLFSQLYLGFRDKFLFNPKYGLDFYLSTRIRHGTLVNQLRNHFQEHRLVTNKNESGAYGLNSYWTDEVMHLNGEEREKCLNRLLEFTESIDKHILTIKDQYIQIKTENRNTDKLACFDFSLRNIEYEIQTNLSQCENVDFNTCVHKIFSSLWVLTEECLRCLREMLDSVKDIMQSELTELVSDILKILGNDKYRMSTLSNAVTSCSTELQNDFAIVNRWFERRNNASFDFTMQYVLDTCITIINNMNQQGLHPNIFNNSQSLFVGDYFNIMYDIFHDLLNNVLNYQKEKGQSINCSINIDEEDNFLHIKVKNWVAAEDIGTIRHTLESYKDKYDVMITSGQVSKEGKTGITKIYNLVSNVLNAIGNSYDNQVGEEGFIANIVLNISKLRKES